MVELDPSKNGLGRVGVIAVYWTLNAVAFLVGGVGVLVLLTSVEFILDALDGDQMPGDTIEKAIGRLVVAAVLILPAVGLWWVGKKMDERWLLPPHGG